MLPKQYRLKSTADFQKIYRNGMKYRGKYGMLIALSPAPHNESSTDVPPQFGFVVSKKIGNAVTRHKMTRWLRSIITEFMAENPEYGANCKYSYVAYEMPQEIASLKKELIESLKLAS
ncbi:MAG: ribonuclease P protein component [Candidatus Dojkabacteria bacterium]|nr:MAG: ribonuclease P protein component [Candidatus Dojkabacteria bacterium]